MKYSITKQLLNKLNESTSNIESVSSDIEKLAKRISEKLNEEGRIIFVGAGLSSEMSRIIIEELWFNFQIPKGKFLSLTAARNYVEDTDTWKELEEVSSTSIFELDELGLTEKDIVIGLSSSGKTQYVLSAVKYAHDIGCLTACITDIDNSEISEYSNFKVNTKFGLPPILGLNAAEGGTIQKIILDLIIYNAMSFAGRIYKNHLVYMKPVSSKIEQYCINTIMELTNLSEEESIKVFDECGKRLEVAVIVASKGCDVQKAKEEILINDRDFNKILN